MEHHHHHHQVAPAQSLNGIFVLSIILNVLFVLVEAGVGLWQNSLSLLSDAGHNLSDVFSLVLVLVAFRLAKVQSNSRFTYGYRKSTVLISLLNAVILLVAVGAIVIESIHKFSEPAEVNGIAVSWTAGVGILINGATALLLMRGQKSDLNVRGAFLHLRQSMVVADVAQVGMADGQPREHALVAEAAEDFGFTRGWVQGFESSGVSNLLGEQMPPGHGAVQA